MEIEKVKLQKVIDWADGNYDGHLTIMKFTSGWKVLFGTPNVDIKDRECLQDLPSEMGLNEAVGVANELHRSFNY